jgi:hypothetical protein
MANRKKYYALPDYQTVTENIDTYLKAWRTMAEPVEQALGVTMTGFDPAVVFQKGNPQSSNVASVQLPVWFVRDLSNSLRKAAPL